MLSAKVPKLSPRRMKQASPHPASRPAGGRHESRNGTRAALVEESGENRGLFSFASIEGIERLMADAMHSPAFGDPWVGLQKAVNDVVDEAETELADVEARGKDLVGRAKKNAKDSSRLQ